MKKHVSIQLSGDVKDKGLSLQVMRIAESLNLVGQAIYLNENSIWINAEGRQDDLDKFLNWLEHEIVMSYQLSIQSKYGKVHNYREFIISKN